MEPDMKTSWCGALEANRFHLLDVHLPQVGCGELTDPLTASPLSFTMNVNEETICVLMMGGVVGLGGL